MKYDIERQLQIIFPRQFAAFSLPFLPNRHLVPSLFWTLSYFTCFIWTLITTGLAGSVHDQWCHGRSCEAKRVCIVKRGQFLWNLTPVVFAIPRAWEWSAVTRCRASVAYKEEPLNMVKSCLFSLTLYFRATMPQARNSRAGLHDPFETSREGKVERLLQQSIDLSINWPSSNKGCHNNPLITSVALLHSEVMIFTS